MKITLKKYLLQSDDELNGIRLDIDDLSKEEEFPTLQECVHELEGLSYLGCEVNTKTRFSHELVEFEGEKYGVAFQEKLEDGTAEIILIQAEDPYEPLEGFSKIFLEEGDNPGKTRYFRSDEEWKMAKEIGMIETE